ncbi:hypothetical protein [Gemella morbillorum]
MERYTYNKELIEKLNIKYFIEKYNLNNEKYNLAIFYALSSVYEHHCRVEQKILTKNLLFGDYYSFVYYSLLKYDLDKLILLTDVMKTGYLGLTKLTMDINSFNRTIISQWFDFYNLTFDEKDSQALTSL